MATFNVYMEKKRYIVHPYRFNLWIFILSLVMIFGGLTSAYIVGLGAVNESKRTLIDLINIQTNPLASTFFNNMIVVLLSSATMQFSYWTARRGEIKKAIIGLLFTFILGIVFLVGQLRAWELLNESGLPLVDSARVDNSASYIIVIAFLHGLHIIAALMALLVVLFKTSLDKFAGGKESRILSFELTGTFWHFLGLLWIYLYIVFLYTQLTYI